MRFTLVAVAVASALAFTSCRKEEVIGREVQVGDNDILLVSTDSFSISAKTVLAEVERTDERYQAMIGAYSDPLFGPLTVSHVTQYFLQEEGFSYGNLDSVFFDSAYVSFRLTGAYREKDFPTEGRSVMHFEVYEVAQDIYLEETYFSDTKVKSKPTVIGEFYGGIGLYDSVYVDGNPEPPQIRIKLDDVWAEQLMRADSSVYSSNESFVQYLKGLYIKAIPTQTLNSNGNIFYFNPLSGFSNITMYYHTANDTNTFSYIPTSETANFSSFQHDYDNSAIASSIDDTVSGSVELYLQSTIGTDVQLELEDIVAKFGVDPKIINLAELIIPVDTNQPYAPLNQLTLSRKLANGSAEFLPDQVETGDRIIDGYYDADNARYRFRITQYIQEIIQNYSPDDVGSETLLISPFGNNIVANRSVISGPRPNTPDAEKMRIIITYTPL